LGDGEVEAAELFPCTGCGLRVVDLDARLAAAGEDLGGCGCEGEDVYAVGVIDRVLGEVLLGLWKRG
jgi:hypothetical protein